MVLEADLQVVGAPPPTRFEGQCGVGTPFVGKGRCPTGLVEAALGARSAAEGGPDHRRDASGQWQRAGLSAFAAGWRSSRKGDDEMGATQVIAAPVLSAQG